MEVLFGIERRLEGLFRRKGFIRGHGTDIEVVEQEDVSSPFLPRKPKAYRRKNGFQAPNWSDIDRNVMTEVGYCNATYKWLSLQAAACVDGDDRDGLVKFFRYMSRSAVSPSRLSYTNPDAPDTSSIQLCSQASLE